MSSNSGLLLLHVQQTLLPVHQDHLLLLLSFSLVPLLVEFLHSHGGQARISSSKYLSLR